MMRRLARSTRTDTLMPYTTLFRSVVGGGHCSSRHLWRHRAQGEGARAKRMGWQGEHIDRIEALVGGQGAGPVRRTASALGFACRQGRALDPAGALTPERPPAASRAFNAVIGGAQRDRKSTRLNSSH